MSGLNSTSSSCPVCYILPLYIFHMSDFFCFMLIWSSSNQAPWRTQEARGGEPDTCLPGPSASMVSENVWAEWVEFGSCEERSCLNRNPCLFSTGPVPLSTYMRIYKKGDIVDIKVSEVTRVSGFVSMFYILKMEFWDQRRLTVDQIRKREKLLF